MRMRSCVFLVLAAAFVAPLRGQDAEGPRRLELSSAEHYTHEFERRVQVAQGKPFSPGHFGQQAMKRVAALKKEYPDHPKVQELYERVARCVRQSRGETFEVTPSMLAYRVAEQGIVAELGARVDAAWAERLEAWTKSSRFLPAPFPAPEPGRGRRDHDLTLRRVVLPGFLYPANEFSNSGSQYVFVGDRQSGMYFVDLSHRNWVRCYEALRRYRRLVSADLPDTWTVVGTIRRSDLLVPRSGERKASDVAVLGWVVQPEAIYIEGKVLALSDGSSGRFLGEDHLAELNARRFTVRSVPAEDDPRAFVAAFAAAVKEKNWDLALDFLDRSWSDSPRALELARRRWDLAQDRFRDQFVHVEPIEVSEVRVLRGEKFGGEEDLEAFFLTEAEKADIQRRADPLLEEVSVRCARFDELGKQVGTPITVLLRRYEGGRWFVQEGLPL